MLKLSRHLVISATESYDDTIQYYEAYINRMNRSYLSNGEETFLDYKFIFNDKLTQEYLANLSNLKESVSIIFLGDQVLKVLLPELEECKLSDLIDYGLPELSDSGNSFLESINKTRSDIHVLNSPNYYIYQNSPTTLKFQLLNILGYNNPPRLLNEEELPYHYHHISDLSRIVRDHYSNIQSLEMDLDTGFDFETRGFPIEDSNFRVLGFSLANDRYRAYFYFSKFDEEYKIELERYGKDLAEVCRINQDKLWVFNNNFENNVMYHLFNERFFFQDVRVLTYLLKTRGSLKFSANLFLNVPLWTETIHEYMDNYLKYRDDPDNIELANRLVTKDPIDGVIDLPTLDRYLKEGMNEWQVVPTQSMGYYCLTGDTMIDLGDRVARLDTLVDTEFDLISLGKDNIPYKTRGTAFHTKDTTELVEIELDNGSVIRCTPEHRFLTSNRGYVEAQSLTELDDLVDTRYVV